MMVAFIHTWDRAGEGDGGGDDDDIVTQTPRKICRRAVLLCIYSTFVMSDHLYIVTKPTSGLCKLDFGISEGFLRKLELGWGEADFGDDDDIVFADTPNNLRTRACTHHTLLPKQTLLCRGLGFRGVGEPLHVQLTFCF